nr:hypothetical protein [Kushneria aurantia]
MLWLIATACGQASPADRLVAKRYIGNLDIEQIRDIPRVQTKRPTNLHPRPFKKAILGIVEEGIQGLFGSVVAQAKSRL